MLGTNVALVRPPHIQQFPTMSNKCPTMLAFVGIDFGIVWPGLKRCKRFRNIQNIIGFFLLKAR